MSLISQIESILFVASKPISWKRISQAVGKGEADVAEAIETLKMKYNRDDSGLRILTEGSEVQMATDPAHADVVDGFVKEEVAGELTRAQLETLTVIVYRGLVTRPELEQIRGVNCSVILRNLLIRGLIEEHEEKGALLPMYRVSFEALRQLGIASATELPDYDNLHAHAHIEQALVVEEGE